MSELNKIVTNFPMSLTDEENRNLALTLSAVVEGGGGGGSADAIWKPAVNEDGILSWTWDENPNPLIPPASADIKGPRGESGAPGRDGTNGTDGTNGKDGKDGTDGKDGEDGKTPQIQINSSNAHWEWRYSGASEWTDLGVVASGAVGPQGIPGVSGASGAPGAKGEDGDDGVSPAVTVSALPYDPLKPQGGTRVTITDKDHPTGQFFDVYNGIDGQGATVNLLEGEGIQIFHTQGTTDYTIGVSADYALKSELPDVTDMATKTWVGQQGYLTSVPDDYATKTYANNASANALSQASAWVESKDFLTQADLANYATETYVSEASANALSEAESWVNQQGFLKSVPAGYATETYANNASANALAESKSWVNQQHFLTQSALDDYATETYVADASAETLSEAKSWVGDNYLPLTGGTVSGQLVVSGTSGDFNAQFLKLVREGVNGHGRVGLGTNGPLAFKVDDANNHTTQVNISPNTSNDQLVQVQHNNDTIGYLIPAKIHQGSYTPTADGVLHIVLES